jgi:hypothetical protein
VAVTEVAEAFGVSRQAVHRRLGWYRDEGLPGLADRSHRPHAHPWQVDAAVEAAICEVRGDHPRWGQRRLGFELGRQGCPGPVPSLSTIYRVLVRHGFISPVPPAAAAGGDPSVVAPAEQRALAAGHARGG